MEKIEPGDAFEKVMLLMVAKGFQEEIVSEAIETRRKVREIVEIMLKNTNAVAKQEIKAMAEEMDKKFQKNMIEVGNTFLNRLEEIRNMMN